MGYPVESGMPKPSKEVKEVPCPRCGKPARKTNFVSGKMTLPMIDCMNCGYSEDGFTIHINDSQN